MRAQLIAVGSELLGTAREENHTGWIGVRLEDAGFELRRRTILPDDVGEISAAAAAALDEGDFVVMTGGLGPTEDDRTREALALVLGVVLEPDPAERARIETLFRSRGFTCGPSQARQAMRPAGAEWIANPVGIAAGLWVRRGNARLAALPGVPGEMQAMFLESVLPRAREALGPGGSARIRRVLKVAGQPESAVDERISDLYGGPDLEHSILLGRDGIELHLIARGADESRARARVGDAEERFAARLGEDLYGRDEETLAGVVGRLLIARGACVATAESCTAGMLAAELTSPAGSSAWFRGGLVVYHDDLKERLCGVPRALLDEHGAVSEPVVRALAEGARVRCGADFALAVSGVAGPGGGRPDKPVGRVHVALSAAEGTVHWETTQIGDRHAIRRRTVNFALDRLRRRLVREGG